MWYVAYGLVCVKECNYFLQWSFGVTMWEIFTCGKVPYTGIHVMGIVTELQRGAVLEMPDNKACSDSMSVVQYCKNQCLVYYRFFLP